MKTGGAVAAAALFCAALTLAAASSGCASAKPRASDRSSRLRAPAGDRVERDDASAHATFEDLQVRVMPDGSFEYLGDLYRDPDELARRVKRDAISGKGRNRQMRPVVLAARGKVPLERLQALRKRFNDEGLPSVAIRSSRVSTVTVSPPSAPRSATPPPPPPANSPARP